MPAIFVEPFLLLGGREMQRDFFSFCTKLSPVERRAIGTYSGPMHIPEGGILYREGDPSDVLFIISRGVVEIIWARQDQHGRLDSAYMSRGDMVGAGGLFTGTTRDYTVRACEPTSLQLFRKEDLPALFERVPAFLMFITEHLSWQLLQRNEASLIQSNCLELSGNLANFDLITVFQTINQSAKTGRLTIATPEGETMGEFHFTEGRPSFGTFGQLHGEEALTQLFLRDLPGTFAFTLASEPADSLGRLPEGRSPEDLLLNALRVRDEFEDVCKRMPPPNAYLVHACDTFNWAGPREYRTAAEHIWYLAGEIPRTVESIFYDLPFSEMTLCSALIGLISSKHFKVTIPDIAPEFIHTNPWSPLRLPRMARPVRRSGAVA